MFNAFERPKVGVINDFTLDIEDLIELIVGWNKGKLYEFQRSIKTYKLTFTAAKSFV